MDVARMRGARWIDRFARFSMRFKLQIGVTVVLRNCVALSWVVIRVIKDINLCTSKNSSKDIELIHFFRVTSSSLRSIRLNIKYFLENSS